MKKRTFVLIRGLGHESRHWGSFSKLLEEQSFCQKLILSELPGSGVRLKDPCYSSVSKISDDIYHTYKDLWLAHKPLALVGLSLGGMVALDLLSKFPDLFSEFFIMNSSIGHLSPFYERMKISAMPKVLNIGFEKGFQKKARLMIELSSKLRVDDKALHKEHVKIIETAPVKFKTLVQQLCAAVLYKGPVKEIKTKGMVLYSKQDELVDHKCSMALAKFLSVKGLVHETAGHDLTLDDAEWVVQNLHEYYGN